MKRPAFLIWISFGCLPHAEAPFPPGATGPRVLVVLDEDERISRVLEDPLLSFVSVDDQEVFLAAYPGETALSLGLEAGPFVRGAALTRDVPSGGLFWTRTEAAWTPIEHSQFPPSVLEEPSWDACWAGGGCIDRRASDAYCKLDCVTEVAPAQPPELPRLPTACGGTRWDPREGPPACDPPIDACPVGMFSPAGDSCGPVTGTRTATLTTRADLSGPLPDTVFLRPGMITWPGPLSGVRIIGTEGVVIQGAVELTDGRLDNVTLLGNATFHGDVTAERIEVRGIVTQAGGSLQVRGSKMALHTAASSETLVEDSELLTVDLGGATATITDSRLLGAPGDAALDLQRGDTTLRRVHAADLVIAQPGSGFFSARDSTFYNGRVKGSVLVLRGRSVVSQCLVIADTDTTNGLLANEGGLLSGTDLAIVNRVGWEPEADDDFSLGLAADQDGSELMRVGVLDFLQGVNLNAESTVQDLLVLGSKTGIEAVARGQTVTILRALVVAFETAIKTQTNYELTDVEVVGGDTGLELRSDSTVDATRLRVRGRLHGILANNGQGTLRDVEVMMPEDGDRGVSLEAAADLELVGLSIRGGSVGLVMGVKTFVSDCTIREVDIGVQGVVGVNLPHQNCNISARVPFEVLFE